MPAPVLLLHYLEDFTAASSIRNSSCTATDVTYIGIASIFSEFGSTFSGLASVASQSAFVSF
jgi:hypothetical protein